MRIWQTFGSEGGWTVPLKWADDLPSIVLAVSFDKDDGVNYASSRAWVADTDHDLAPAFVNDPGEIDGKPILLMGGGMPLLDEWLENWYCNQSRWKNDLISDVRSVIREIIVEPPTWLVNWLRSEVNG